MEFWEQVKGRLEEEERSMSWLGRRIGVKRAALGNYVSGYRPTPEHVRKAVTLVLDLREKVAA
jgi:hypothetical protein